jgi:hypothetical protein
LITIFESTIYLGFCGIFEGISFYWTGEFFDNFEALSFTGFEDDLCSYWLIGLEAPPAALYPDS